MALAILKLKDKRPGKYIFFVDTGSSPWWELVTGGAVYKQGNAEFIEDRSTVSPLRGPENNNLRTGREIQINESLFNEQNRFIQLFAYKSKDKTGFTFSGVIDVKPRLRDQKARLDELPDLRIPRKISVMTSAHTSNKKNVFSFEETPLSGAMGFMALLPLIEQFLPTAIKAIGGSPDKEKETGTAAANGPSSTAPAKGGFDPKALLSAENIKKFFDFISSLQQQNKTATANSLPGAVSPFLLSMSFGALPGLSRLVTPEAITAIGNNPQKLYAALADAFILIPDKKLIRIKQEMLKRRPLEASIKYPPHSYSEAKIAPALLAALPALLPAIGTLAEKAPGLVNAVGDQGTKLLEAIQGGLLNFNKEQNRHLEANIPKGVNADEVIKQMLGAISAYNAISFLEQAAAPQQPATQSIVSNALYHAIPLLEKAMADDETGELQEKTSDLVERIRKELVALQEEIKRKVATMVPDLKTINTEDVPAALSIFGEERSRYRYCQGNNIFGNSTATGYRYNGDTRYSRNTSLLAALLPMAISGEYRNQKDYKSRSFSFSHRKSAPPSGADPATALLLQKIEDIKFLRSLTIPMEITNTYEIEVVGSKTVSVNGISKVLYVKEKGIGFVLKIHTNSNKTTSLLKAIVQVQIKNNEDTAVIATKKVLLTNFIPGELTEQLRFEPGELSMLPFDCDLLVHFSFAWKDDKNITKGTRKTHAIQLTEGYVLGHSGETIKGGIPLNDVNSHRNFWHKVWEGRSQGERTNFNITCRYYLHYDVRSSQNSFLETKTMISEERTAPGENEKEDVFIKMRSGMEISPVALNLLLPRISPYPSLNEYQLKALRHYEFKKEMDTLAQARFNFRSKKREMASLWVYPEVDLFKLTLQKAGNVNMYGNVLDTTIEEFVFVRPSAVHFIGTKNV